MNLLSNKDIIIHFIIILIIILVWFFSLSYFCKLFKKCTSTKKTSSLKIFTSEYCPHCIAIKPIIKELIKESENLPANVEHLDVNSPKNADQVIKYSATRIPKILIEKNDGSIVEFSGERSLKNIKKFIDVNSI